MFDFAAHYEAVQRRAFACPWYDHVSDFSELMAAPAG
jgi:hypothetical protein